MEKEISQSNPEAQRVPYRINPRRNMPRHILIKLTKTKCKERILKAAREKQQVTYKGNPIHLIADLSAETLQTRREWQDIFNYYSAIKKNTFESVLMRWMKLEPIIQSEVTQKEKHQYSILTHIYGI